MPSLYDPRRRRIGDIPTLNAGTPGFAVPRLTIWPEEAAAETSHLVRLSATIPVAGEGYLAREVSKSIPASFLPEIIAQYRADPEQFLETFFNINLNAIAPRKPNGEAPVSKTGQGVRFPTAVPKHSSRNIGL